MNRTSRLIINMLLLGVLLMPIGAAHAQQEGVLVISPPDTASFPEVRFHMDAYDEQGRFISNLKADDVQILEDEQSLKPARVDKIRNGIQITVAINVTSVLAKQTETVPEYERLQSAISDWAASQSEQALDDYSLSTPTGLFLIRSREPGEMAKAIRDYQPELARAQSSLNSLAEALDLATDPPGRPLLKRSIFYITPALPADQTAALEHLAERARQIGVRVHVWMVGVDAGDDQAAKLDLFAKATGGLFAAIPTGAPLPDIEALFREYRSTYEIHYTSAVQKSGSHTISVQIEKGNLAIESNANSFNLNVSPPNPIFLSPPDSIQRTWTTGSPTPALAPDAVSLQILIEFPDQLQRDLRATRLYVNNNLVDENTSAPFDRFAWDITSIETSSRQMLRVEAEDVLGLIGSSIDVPVEIEVAQPASTSVIRGYSGRGILAITAVVISGIVLVLVLFLTGTAQPERWKRRRAEQQRMKDPVTQPVPVRKDTSKPQKGKSAGGQKSGKNGISAPRSSSAWPVPAWPRINNPPTAPARLIALDENEQPVTGGSIQLTRQEITFGSDPRRAIYVLESPTVDGLHARLTYLADGQMLLSDQGSVAGTWVNYEPVGADGVKLAHGDLIHIGRVMYRFERTDASAAAPVEIKVTTLEM